MNFSDFKKLLGADPYSLEAQTKSARDSNPEFAAAALQAEEFERKLEGATNIQPPEQLLADILALTEQQTHQPQASKGRNTWLMASAATIFMAVGAGSVLLWQQQQYSSIEDYVQKHVAYDGESVLRDAIGSLGVSQQQVSRAMSKYATLNPELLATIQYIKTCPTPNGKGVHFVISTNDGPITVIYMPETSGEDVQPFSVNSQRAHIIPLDRGSIAIIAGSDAAATAITPFLRTGIQPLSVDT